MQSWTRPDREERGYVRDFGEALHVTLERSRVAGMQWLAGFGENERATCERTHEHQAREVYRANMR
jgi:hypothetical protein